MTSVLLTSAKGAPGVTTAGCALTWAWPEVTGRRVLLVDADPAGGGVVTGWLRGDSGDRGGLPGVAAARGGEPLTAVTDQVVALDRAGDRLLLAGVPDAGHGAVLAQACVTLAAALPRLAVAAPPVDVIVDAGRVTAAATPVPVLRGVVDLVVLVTGSSLPAVTAARAAARGLRAEVGARLRLLVVAPGRPYRADEIADVCDARLVGALPWDPRTAGVFSHGDPPGRGTSRTPYARAVRAAVTALAVAAAEASPADPDRDVVEVRRA